MRKNPMRVPNYALWPTESFGCITNFISRGNAPNYVGSSSFYAIGQRCISMNGFKAEKARPHDLSQMPSPLVPREGDVLVNSTGTGTIGRSCVFPGGDEFAVDGHVTLLRVRNKIADPRWVNAILRSTWGQSHLESQCYSGSTNQVELSRARLARTSVPLPPIAEQRKIAEVLDALDEASSSCAEGIAKLGLVRRGISSFYMDSDSGVRKPLGDVLFGIQSGKSPDVPGYPAASGQWGVLKVSAVGAGGFVSTENKVVLDPSQIFSELEVRHGDLLMTRANTPDLVGMSCLVENPSPRLMMSDKILRLHVREDEANKKFVDFLLRSESARNQIGLLGTGSSGSMKNISRPEVRSLMFSWPDLEEQHRIVSIIKAHDERIAAERARLEKLRKLRTGLMDDLLTGRVRVEELQDLPV